MTRRVLGIALLLACVCGCATKGDSADAAADSGWTRRLAESHITGSVADLAAPRDYAVAQIAGGGPVTPSSGDGGYVLADLTGPGCVVRLYSEGLPEGRVAVFIDDNPEPQYAGPLNNVYLSTIPVFMAPVSDSVNGGNYAYTPIPYGESCRIVYYGAEAPAAYQVTYATFHNDASWPSFTLTPLSKRDKAYFDLWRSNWTGGTGVRLHDLETERLHTTKNQIFPHKNIRLYRVEGPATITEIELEIRGKRADVLDDVWLAIYWDGQEEPGVFAPVGALFGSAIRGGDYGGPVFGRQGDRLYLRYPMPFAQHAEIRLVNTSDQKVDYSYNLTWRDGATEPRYFHARYNEATTKAGEPYTVARIFGKGHYVGTVFAARGGDSEWFLAGPENIRVDFSPIPQFTGTSTGGYFNTAWTMGDAAFSGPGHGVTVRGDRPSSYDVAAYRIHNSDAIPFTEALEFTLNHGPHNNQPGLHYASVAYWYQDGPAEMAALWPAPGVDLAPRPAMEPEWAGQIAGWAARDKKK